MKNSLCKSLGKRIRALRTKLKLSQEALADVADMDRTYLGGIERGERNPSLANLQKISKALHVSLSELFREIDA